MNCPICNENLNEHTKHDLDTCATKLVGKNIKPTILMSDLYALVRAIGCTVRIFSDGPTGVSIFLDVPGLGMRNYAWGKPSQKKLLVKQLLELAITEEPDIKGFEGDAIIIDEAPNIELEGEGIDAIVATETD